MDVRQRAAAELVERVNNELANYNYSVTGELNESENGSVVIFTVTCTESEADNYPTLELSFDRFTNKDDHEIWVAIPTLSFPTLVYKLEDDYQDTIEYYLDRWAKLGTAITQINKIDFDYTAFAEEDSEDVESATDIEAAADVDRESSLEVGRYLHTLIGDLDSALSAAGIQHTIESTDDSSVILNILLEDGTEVGVEHSDVSWNWDNLEADVANVVEQIKSDNMNDTIQTSTEVLVQPGDEEIVYGDPDGMFGEAGTVSLAEIKEYWSREHENDPSLSYYDSFDAWFADTRQWLSEVEACQSTEGVLGYTYDDDTEEDTGWRELQSKMVPDSDGFMTDYTLYESTSPENSCQYICMFGDRDVYKPDEGYADMTFDDLGEAEDWFYSYEGLLDDEEILSDSEVNVSEEEPEEYTEE